MRTAVYNSVLCFWNFRLKTNKQYKSIPHYAAMRSVLQRNVHNIYMTYTHGWFPDRVQSFCYCNNIMWERYARRTHSDRITVGTCIHFRGFPKSISFGYTSLSCAVKRWEIQSFILNISARFTHFLTCTAYFCILLSA